MVSACQPISDTPTKQWLHADGGAYAANISNDGTISAVSSVQHGIGLWDLEKNALRFQWSQEQNSADNLVLAIDIANDNSHVLTANRSAFALWDANSGESIGYWKVRESTIRDIALSDKGKYLLIGKANGVVVHVTPDTGRRLEFLGHNDRINSVDMLPNGRIAISGGSDYMAYVWDTQSGQKIYQFNHPSRVTKVAIDPNGKYAFTADSKKSAHIWDLKTGKLLSSLKYTNRQEVFSSVSFSPNGQYLLTGAPTRKVSLWQVGTGERVDSWTVTPRPNQRPSSAVVHSVAFKDNNHILTESSSGYGELWQRH